MTAFDFTPLFRSSVGFERLMSALDGAMRSEDAGSHYPPYNIEKTGEDAYRITLAVAGFRDEDLSIEVRDGELVAAGSAGNGAKGTTFLHQGIAARKFRRVFRLAEHVKATGARLEHGLLAIDLVREVPEALKPRTIEIASAAPKVIDRAA